MAVELRQHPGPALLEREREALAAALASSVDGHGGAVRVEGPPGIGKSRLLDGLRRLAQEAGTRVLDARAAELEQGFAFGVARQLFEGVTSIAPAADLPAALEELYQHVAVLAEDAPVLLCVDDAEWGDDLSLRFLDFLERRIAERPVLVAVAGWPEEPQAGPAWRAIVDRPLTVVRPGPLGSAAVTRLVRERLGSEAGAALGAACQQATAGNPLYLRELLTALEGAGGTPTAADVAAAGPAAIARYTRHRLGRLPPEANALADAVALLDTPVDAALAGRIAGLDDEATWAAADALVRAGVLRRDVRLAFAAPVVGVAILAARTPGERLRGHAAAAHALAEAGAPPVRVDAHLLRTTPAREPWRVEPLRAEAAEARAGDDPTRARRALARALAEPPATAAR